MFQKEMAKRIMAKVNKKNYGRLIYIIKLEIQY